MYFRINRFNTDGHIPSCKAGNGSAGGGGSTIPDVPPRPPYGGKMNSKTLVVIVCLAVSCMAMVTILPEENDAATSITPDQFLALDEDDDGVISLQDDYVLSSYVSITENLTVEMNGHSLSSPVDVFRMDTVTGLSLTIHGDSERQSTLTGGDTRFVVCNNYKSGSLYIDGVTMNSGYPILWYGSTEDVVDTIEISNCAINGIEAGAWISNKAIEHVTITGSDISGKIGLFLGTVVNSVIEDCNIHGEQTGVHIKSGTASITGCNISSDTYHAEDALPTSGYGPSFGAVVLDNQYNDVISADSTGISIMDSTLSTNSTDPDAKAVVVVQEKTDGGSEPSTPISLKSNCILFEDVTSFAADDSGSLTINDVVPGDELPTEISLNVGTASLTVGESMVLTATVYPDIGLDVLWTSSDSSVVSVIDGVVVAVGAGVATVTATVNGMTLSDYCVFTVSENFIPPIWDDDDDYVPPIVPSQTEDSGDDDTTTIVACAAAAVVAALIAAFLILDRRQ